jgi:hypothetical protein
MQLSFGHGVGWTAGQLLLMYGMSGCVVVVEGESHDTTPIPTISPNSTRTRRSAVGAPCWLSTAGPGGGVGTLKASGDAEEREESFDQNFGCHSEWSIYVGEEATLGNPPPPPPPPFNRPMCTSVQCPCMWVYPRILGLSLQKFVK